MNFKRFVFWAFLAVSAPLMADNYQVQADALRTPVNANIIAPSGVAVNSRGEVVVTSRGTYKVMVFDASGNFLRGFGQDVIKAPHGLRVDGDDNVWITDIEQHLVLKLSPEGRLLMVLGQQNNQGTYDEIRKMALFYKPADVAFGLNGDIYVADGYGNSRVVQFSEAGDFIRDWGEAGNAPNQFNNPHNLVVADNGKVFVADRHNKRIQIFNDKGQLINSWAHLGTPWGLAADKNKLYMTDGNSEQVLIIYFDGKVVNSFGVVGQLPGRLRAVHGIAVDNDENIWVTEVLNWRVQKFVKP